MQGRACSVCRQHDVSADGGQKHAAVSVSAGRQCQQTLLQEL